MAKLMAPTIGQAISMQQLAKDLADKHGEALAKELTNVLAAKLLDQDHAFK